VIDDTVGMAAAPGGLAVGGDVELALAGLPVPSYVLDTTGVVRWLNPAAERLLGDVRGKHFTSIVGPEDKAKAQELFTRKVLGTTAATESSGVFVSTDGTRLALDVSAVPLMGGVEDKTRVPQPLPAVEKLLVISGVVVMGGVVVKN